LCLQGELTPKLLCCQSGNVDRCGVCDGDGSSCPTAATVTFSNVGPDGSPTSRRLRALAADASSSSEASEDSEDSGPELLFNGVGYVDVSTAARLLVHPLAHITDAAQARPPHSRPRCSDTCESRFCASWRCMA
jgi:hypothetical protein